MAALYYAESGLERFVAEKLRNSKDWSSLIQKTYFSQESFGEGTYSVKVLKRKRDRIDLEVTGRCRSAEKRVQVTVYREKGRLYISRWIDKTFETFLKP